MKLIVLTSTRADYSIYRPLLIELDKDNFFDLNLIVFGSHLKKKHGYTIEQIEKDGFTIRHKVHQKIVPDSALDISDSMADTMRNFASIWNKEKATDLVICLGDRYEMFAAVAASIPYGLPVAHIHGGETTLGAIDETFRHSLTTMSSFHFTSAEAHLERVASIKGSTDNIYNVGSLSLLNIPSLSLFTISEFESKWNVDLSLSTILFTFHPETVASDNNETYASVLRDTLDELSKKHQILITLPNLDTSNKVLRDVYLNLAKSNANIKAVESLGMQGYFSAMHYSKLLVGNTSSGLLEAASFQKYVVNIGDRQKGRARSENVVDVPVVKADIIEAVSEVIHRGDFTGDNIFYNPDGLDILIKALKSI